MRRHYTLLLIVLSLLAPVRDLAQCTNGALYPPNAVAPDPGGNLTQITGCSYQTEYSRITGIMAATGYVFAIADGSYITVRGGAVNGPVLSFGYSPLTVVTSSSEDLYVHWNTNAECGTATECLLTTVRRLVGCVPPSVTATTVNHCLSGEFTVNVDVVDAGDATSLSFAYTVNGGGLSVQAGVVPGVYELGPFALGALVDLTVVHGDASDCNVQLSGITDSSCVIIGCGPDTYTYCYGNNDDYLRTYQSASGYPIRVLFNNGEVSPSGNDALVIHNGPSESDPVLFSGVGNAGDLTGVSVISSNPDNALTVRFTSNSSFSCADGGGLDEWNYTVSCLDCIPVSASADSVHTDCDEQLYSVQVVVSAMGTDTAVEIANDAGVAPTSVTAPGTYWAGPFPSVLPVRLSVVSDEDSLCTVDLGLFESGFCPTHIVCDGPALSETFCYEDLEVKRWLYLRDGTGALSLQFSAGSIEQVAYDQLRIHDGVDDTAPILWEHTSPANSDLAGVLAVSSGPALYMELNADYSVSCGAGSFAPWQWSVQCLDCTAPTATYEVVPDCIHHAYAVEVEVTGLGSGTDTRITDSWTGDTLVTGLGTTVVGPIPVGTPVLVTVINGQDQACRVTSPPLNYAAAGCVQVGCATTNMEHCYADADTAWFIFQSDENVPITISFNSGQLLPNDNVMLYNGLDTDAQLVYAGNLGGDISGLALSSSNADNALTLLVASDGQGSCVGGQASPAMQWTVGCGLVGARGYSMEGLVVYPRPASGELRIQWPDGMDAPVLLRLFDIAGRCVLSSMAQARPGTVHRMDVERFESGRYILQVDDAGSVQCVPVVIAR
jgi:Secretion system C-terminal sorting domain